MDFLLPSLFSEKYSVKVEKHLDPIFNLKPDQWNIENIKILLDKGSSLSSKDEDDNTFLLKFLDKGYSHNGPTNSKGYRDFEFLKFLLENGANVNDRDNADVTVLMKVIEDDNDIEAVKLLVEKGADINAEHCDGWAPVDFAGRNKYDEIVKFLYDNGDTTLLKLVQEDDYTLHDIKYVLNKGAKINVKDKDGNTPLSTVLKMNHYEIASFLIENGATINQGNFNKEILLIALKHGYNEIVEILT
jgi:ankyrin repeat protein